MKAGAPKGNKNAEKWTEESAEQFLNKAIDLSKERDEDGHPVYDFIGEVACDMGVDKGTFDYLVDKFPSLSPLRAVIKAHCEANCFRNAKKGRIVASLGIINLKSNHGWTDRNDITTANEKLPEQKDNLTPELLKKIVDKL